MPIAADNPLGLRLPQQSPPTREIMTRPKDMEAWIAQLPVASATETARQLLRTLQGLNRTPLPPLSRFQLAELLAKPIGYVIGTLENRYLDVLFPLSEKTKLTAFVCTRLSEELAFAYKRTVHDLAMGKIGSQERKLLVLALFRSVRHLADVVYQSALVYQLPPAFLWRELHSLFTFAETQQWAATRIKVHIGAEGADRVTTLRDLYLQALLFAMATPIRLRQREIRTLYHTLPQWTGSVRCGAWANPGPSETRFVVQMKQDQPPQHSVFVSGPVERPALELDTGPLIQLLRERFDRLPPESGALVGNSQPDELSKATLRCLIQSWGTTPRRQHVRTRLNFELTVAVGLSAVYFLAAGEGAPRQRAALGANFPETGAVEGGEVNEESTFSSELLEMDSGLALVPMDTDTDRTFLRGQDSFGVVTEKEKGPTPPIWAQTPAPQAGASPPTTLHTLNESAGGYCVDWSDNNAPRVKVGELVGIQVPTKPSTYGLAVVRWMRDAPQQGLQIGLQLLAPSIVAVTITHTEQRRPTPTQCLLVPELKSADRPASLITPVMPFRVDENLFIRHDDSERRVRLARLLEVTGAFTQFQFEYE